MATRAPRPVTGSVRDALDGMGLDEEFVVHLSNTSLSDVDDQGIPRRAAFFADMVTEMWEQTPSV